MPETRTALEEMYSRVATLDRTLAGEKTNIAGLHAEVEKREARIAEVAKLRGEYVELIAKLED